MAGRHSDRMIAVTGATGFVGQALLDAAAEEQIPIRALARRPQQKRDGVEWIAGDLSSQSALAELVSGAQAVIHVAGLTNTPDPAQFEAANVGGTRNILDHCRSQGVARCVFVSSLSAREPELSRYGRSKSDAEALVRDSGLDWTIVRPPAVYGPRDTDMLELFRAAKFGVVPLPPAGRTSIIHADDLARLLLALTGPGDAHGDVLEPDDGRPGGYAHKQLAALIGDAVGRRVLAPHLPRALLELGARADRLIRGDGARLTPDRVGYMTHPDWVCDPARAVPETIWKPRIPGREGLSATADWYRGKGWL